MATSTVPALPDLTPTDEAYIQRQLTATILSLGGQLIDASGDRLETLVCDVYDQLPPLPDGVAYDRHQLGRASAALAEYVEHMLKTAATLHQLVATIALGWIPDED